MNKISKLLVSLGLVFTLGLSSDINAAVTFKTTFSEDPQLAKCVAGNFNKSINDVATNKELESIKHLDCQDANIKSVAGISNLKNLSNINLKNNNITRVAELNTLNLVSIDLSYNKKIKDINTLYYITSLKELFLDATYIDKIEIIGDFKGLTKLSLAKNKIKDASFIGSLKKLNELDISNNEVKSLNFLSKLGSLEQLDSSYNNIGKVMYPPLKLKTLNISNNKIDTIISLKNNKALYYLDIANNKVNDISFLETNSNLKYLDISSNAITSIEKLNGLSSLEVVTLDYSKITDKDKLSSNVLKLYERNDGDFTIEGLEEKASKTNKEGLIKYWPIIGFGAIVLISIIGTVIFVKRRRKAKEYTEFDDKITLDLVDTSDAVIVDSIDISGFMEEEKVDEVPVIEESEELVEEVVDLKPETELKLSNTKKRTKHKRNINNKKNTKTKRNNTKRRSTKVNRNTAKSKTKRKKSSSRTIKKVKKR